MYFYGHAPNWSMVLLGRLVESVYCVYCSTAGIRQQYLLLLLHAPHPVSVPPAQHRSPAPHVQHQRPLHVSHVCVPQRQHLSLRPLQRHLVITVPCVIMEPARTSWKAAITASVIMVRWGPNIWGKLPDIWSRYCPCDEMWDNSASMLYWISHQMNIKGSKRVFCSGGLYFQWHFKWILDNHETLGVFFLFFFYVSMQFNVSSSLQYHKWSSNNGLGVKLLFYREKQECGIK